MELVVAHTTSGLYAILKPVHGEGYDVIMVLCIVIWSRYARHTPEIRRERFLHPNPAVHPRRAETSMLSRNLEYPMRFASTVAFLIKERSNSFRSFDLLQPSNVISNTGPASLAHVLDIINA